MKSKQMKEILVAVAAAFAVSATSAFAADDGGSGKGAMGPSADHGARGANQPGEVGGRGKGQGGPDETSDAKGPRYGGEGAKPAPGTQGGRPAWAGGAVPEDVELGRLNVARSPSHVLDRALAEALATINPALYNLSSLDQVIAQILAETAVRIDSPLQNLGLYKDLVSDGQVTGLDPVASTDRYVMLAAIFIGGAADKTLPVTTDVVVAINTIMGLTLPSNVTAEQIAVAADAVRVAILKAHDE